jgi:hypothetical protein
VEANPSAVVEASLSAIVEANPSALVEANPLSLMEANPSAAVEANPSALMGTNSPLPVEVSPLVMEEIISPAVATTTSPVVLEASMQATDTMGFAHNSLETFSLPLAIAEVNPLGTLIDNCPLIVEYNLRTVLEINIQLVFMKDLTHNILGTLNHAVVMETFYPVRAEGNLLATHSKEFLYNILKIYTPSATAKVIPQATAEAIPPATVQSILIPKVELSRSVAVEVNPPAIVDVNPLVTAEVILLIIGVVSPSVIPEANLQAVHNGQEVSSPLAMLELMNTISSIHGTPNSM